MKTQHFIWKKFYEYFIICILASRKIGPVPISFELILLLNYRLLVCEILIISPGIQLIELLNNDYYDLLTCLKYLSKLAKMLKFYDFLKLNHPPIGIQNLYIDDLNDLKLEEFDDSKSRLYQTMSFNQFEVYSNCPDGFNVPEFISLFQNYMQALINNPDLLSQSNADVYSWGLILLILFRVVSPKQSVLKELDKMKTYEKHRYLLDLVDDINVMKYKEIEKRIKKLAFKCLNFDPKQRIKCNKLYKEISKIKNKIKKKLDPNYKKEKLKNFKNEKNEKIIDKEMKEKLKNEEKERKKERKNAKFKKFLNLNHNFLQNRSLNLKNCFQIPFDQKFQFFIDEESKRNINFKNQLEYIGKNMVTDFEIPFSGINSKITGFKNKIGEKSKLYESKDATKSQKNIHDQEKDYKLTALEEPFNKYYELIEKKINDYVYNNFMMFKINGKTLDDSFLQFIKRYIKFQNVVGEIKITVLGSEHDTFFENLKKNKIKFCLICNKSQEFNEMIKCITDIKKKHIRSKVSKILTNNYTSWNFSTINLRLKEIFLIESLIPVSYSLLLIDFCHFNKQIKLSSLMIVQYF